MINVYTIDNCGWCKKTIALLKKNKIKYKEKNLDKNKRYLKELVSKVGEVAVPLIDTGTNIISGYDEYKIKKEFNIK